MHNPIYEIKLDDDVIRVSYDIWADIQSHARGNKWFYVLYNGDKYRYDHDRTFLDRSTIFCFEKLENEGCIEIDLITVE